MASVCYGVTQQKEIYKCLTIKLEEITMTTLFSIISIVAFVGMTMAVLNEAISFIREVMFEE